MNWRILPSVIAASLLTAVTTATDSPPNLTPTDECPILGATFSSDFDLTQTDAFADAAAAFPDVIETLISSGVVSNTSSFHIDVYSTVTNTSIYSYSHKTQLPALNETFTKDIVDGETIFKIGSVSKLFTVYAILLAGGGLTAFDIPVTRYLPELIGNAEKDRVEYIDWEKVTIGALASQQGGSGQFPASTYVCLPFGNETCIDVYLEEMRDTRRPVQAVFREALYADGGFGVLGRVLERMTGQPYNDALRSTLGNRLGFNVTASYQPPKEGLNAVVIPGDITTTSWGYDNQIIAPSGGLYSNAADFRALGLSILNAELLDAATIRSWMKPRAHTASLTISLGAPWEIYRLTLPVDANSTRTRVSDLYTKGGGQPGYTSIFALSPDHQIGYSVFVAGPAALVDRWPIRAAVGEVFVVAAEHAGRENALKNFAGDFATDGGATNFSITIDNDQPAIGLSGLFIDGADYFGNISAPNFVPAEVGLEQVVRLYPTGLESESKGGVKKLKYRAVAGIIPKAPRSQTEGGTGLFEDSCLSWFNTGFNEAENGVVLDEFVFEVEHGKLVRVGYPAAEKALERV